MTDTDGGARIEASYDRLARRYAELFMDQLDDQPIDRAMLAAFAELVLEGGPPRVLDLGCGPGHVTAHLASLGLDASGLDASPVMVTIARSAWPELEFELGDMADTGHGAGTCGGVLSRYGTIHASEAAFSAACEEFARLLVPGGLLLVSFFGATTRSQHGEPFDHAVATAYRRHPDLVVESLHEADLIVELRQLRQPGPGERFDQVTLLARRAGT